MDLHENGNQKQDKADLLLNGFNFSGGLLALTALKSGLEIAIKIPQTFEHTFHPELSNFYPMAVVDSLQSLSNFNFLLKCSGLFPNHFFPQRVLSFNSNKNLNKSLNNTFDLLLKRDRESASLPVKTEKYKTYQSFSQAYPLGTLVYEYRFDRNRAIIDLLKLCVEGGATIVSPKMKLDSQCIVNCNPIKRDYFSIDIENYKWPYQNSFHFEQKDFSITFQGVENKTTVQLYLYNSELNFDDFKNDVIEIFNNLNIAQPNFLEHRLSDIFNNTEFRNELNIQKTDDPVLSKLRNETMNLIKQISFQLKHKIDLNKMFHTNKDNVMKHEKFRLIQNECDEKFDLAKQTGIIYDHFILIFYRYRNHIDLMIEAAYEMMNDERDPVKIWNSVERDFLRKELLFLS